MTKRFNSALEVIAEFNSRRLHQNFCHIPFTTLILEPDGLVGSCRNKGSEFPVGNITDQSLDEIWNGPFIRQWRREFLSGSINICKTEVRQSACHLCPDYNSLLPDFTPSEYQSGSILRLGLNLNGRCNLKCRMCHIWKKPNGLYNSLVFWNVIEKLIPSLKEVELFSGEPFIQKDTYKLIEIFREKNPSCLWSITTNGHWKLTDTVTRSLDKIRFKHLIVSIDSLDPDTYAMIRRGGDLNVVLRNLNRLRDYDRSRTVRNLGKLNLRINLLIQKDNWHELGNFFNFGDKMGLEISRCFLHEPREFSLLSLSEKERESILDYYLINLNRDQLARSMRIIVPLLDSLPEISRYDYLLQLKNILTFSNDKGYVYS